MFSAAKWTRGVVLTLLTGAFLAVSATYCNGAIILAQEDFDGYTSFLSTKPVSSNDKVNLGVPVPLPLATEGSDSALWLAARFQAGGNVAGSKSIANDVGVQKEGDPITHNNPVGRVGDNAGLILRLDLTGYVNVTVDFDWRTYLNELAHGDQFVVAYYKGDGTAFQAEGLGDPNNTYDWFNDPQLGNGSNTWYATNWVELLRANPNNLFSHEQFSLPGDDIVYLAFWNDDNQPEVDYAKFDNVLVMGDIKPDDHGIPEPCSLVLMGLGLALVAVAGRRRDG